MSLAPISPSIFPIRGKVDEGLVGGRISAGTLKIRTRLIEFLERALGPIIGLFPRKLAKRVRIDEVDEGCVRGERISLASRETGKEWEWI